MCKFSWHFVLINYVVKRGIVGHFNFNGILYRSRWQKVLQGSVQLERNFHVITGELSLSYRALNWAWITLCVLTTTSIVRFISSDNVMIAAGNTGKRYPV